MKNLLFAVFILSAFCTTAQQNWCGTVHDQETATLINERALQVREFMRNNPVAQERDDEIIWIPVKYHLISTSNPATAAKVNNILGLHCRLNEEYAEHDIQFYINDGFNYFESEAAYNDPSANSVALGFQKDPGSLNIFVAQSADTDSGLGTTLGYYTPQFDWIVMRKSESDYSSTTLGHEVGHFFSLPHTFNGWDCTSWADENISGCAPTTAPCDGTPVEFQDGSNCETAGDFLCDTPPDYNFGFGTGGCNWTQQVCDPQGDIVAPMENNHMSYFLGCSDYVFTDGQIEQVYADIETPERNYLKFDGGPDNSNEITEIAQLSLPADDSVVEIYNGVSFEWSDVPHSTTYFLQIAQNQGMNLNTMEYFDWQPGAYIDFLQENTQYFWRVRAYNEYSTCSDWSDVNSFTTGSATTSVNQISEVQGLTITPNPVAIGAQLNVSLQAAEAFAGDVQLVNLNGQVLKTLSGQSFRAGQNTVNLTMDNLATGLYFVRIQNKNGVVNRRVVVSK